MAAILYLIRHATPDWSRTDIRYDIPPGPPLTAQGEAEATQLAEFLRPISITHLYASPLERTTRTAQIAATALGLPIEIKPELAEWNHSEVEVDVLTRFRPFINTMFDESAARGPLGLVTHGGPIRLLLAEFGLDHNELDYYRRAFDHNNPLPPAGVWRVTRAPNGLFEKPEFVFTPNPYTPYTPTIVNL